MDEAFVALSLPPILIGMFAAIACALPGNFLILRRQALIGDAISHVVLPGIVVAFLVTGAVTKKRTTEIHWGGRVRHNIDEDFYVDIAFDRVSSTVEPSYWYGGAKVSRLF